ncbi:MAG: NADH-quinone oxidoreductase subunit N [Verrucomicrobiota bacterium]|nr:NADH-quinone oxidoreductase subunit N [Verrucomicrobiota bacterium]
MIPAASLEFAAVILGLALLLVEAFADRIDKRVLAVSGIVGLTALFIGTFFIAPPPATAAATGFWHFYAADPLAIFFKRFALGTTIFVLIMMIDYAPVLRQSVHGATHQSGLGEFFALPIFTCAGLMWMASAIDFIMIFVSLEVVTMSFYVLVTFTRRNPLTLEAGVKYLILSALSTGFLVYGITWIFGVTGETNLARIGVVLAAGVDRAPALFGIALVLVALGFKIAAVPFQIWVPDVYQGAPTPITAFLSVGSKAAGFVVLLRVLQPFFIMPQVQKLLVGIAFLTLIYGNFAALPQSNLKRLLAYSSIAHAGYLLIGVVSLAGAAVSFYLAGYLFMTMLSFAVLVVVGQQTGDEIKDFNGLAKRSPFLAFAMLLAMASLAGVPFTVGFLGKFYIFDAAVRTHQVALAAAGVVTVACGFYYYLKLVRAMYWESSTSDAAAIPVSALSRFAMILLMIGIIVLGVYPQPILNALR